jgi:8-amino-7-oxononanoate synthase
MTSPKPQQKSLSQVSALRDPFGGLFDRDPECPNEPLIDTPPAHAWFELLRWGLERDLYTYQQPLSARSGARVRVNGESLLMLSSYDYLGLIGHPRVTEAAVAAVRAYGTGTGGVRLLTGTTELHLELERELADFKGTEAAITFSSGYAANLAVIPSLVGPRDRVLLDAKAHHSIVDAVRLAKATVRRFEHNDVTSLERALRTPPDGGRTLIVVEGLYSMDGDICPLPDLIAAKEEHGAFLMVDEAHSFGTLGDTGRGVDERFGLPSGWVDVWTGSLSKAIPANGGFVAGSRALIVYLQHAAAPFVFSSALCPAATAAACEALRLVRAEPERLVTLEANSATLRQGLQALGYDTGCSESCIIPVMLGDDERAYRMARHLLDLGVLVTAVVRPAVPRGAARLRLCATAEHSAADLDEALDAFDTSRCCLS